MILNVQQWTSSRDVLEAEASVGINANWDMRGELRLEPFWVGSNPHLLLLATLMAIEMPTISLVSQPLGRFTDCNK